MSKKSLRPALAPAVSQEARFLSRLRCSVDPASHRLADRLLTVPGWTLADLELVLRRAAAPRP